MKIDKHKLRPYMPRIRGSALAAVKWLLKRYKDVTREEIQDHLEWEDGTIYNTETERSVDLSTLSDTQLRQMERAITELRTNIDYAQGR